MIWIKSIPFKLYHIVFAQIYLVKLSRRNTYIYWAESRLKPAYIFTENGKGMIITDIIKRRKVIGNGVTATYNQIYSRMTTIIIFYISSMCSSFLSLSYWHLHAPQLYTLVSAFDMVLGRWSIFCTFSIFPGPYIFLTKALHLLDHGMWLLKLYTKPCK